MKDLYKNWEELKKDAALEKVTDLAKDKGVASVTFKDVEEPLIYKKVDETWVLQTKPEKHREVKRFK